MCETQGNWSNDDSGDISDLFKPAPSDSMSPERVLLPKKRTHQFNSFLRPRLQFCFKSLNYHERCRLLIKLNEILQVLGVDFHDFQLVFEDFYYDVQREDFETLASCVEEELQVDICFLEEYQHEMKEMLLNSNVERDFWEFGVKKPRKPAKNKRKSKRKGKSLEASAVDLRIKKLLLEREEFFASERAAYGLKRLKNGDNEPAFSIRTKVDDALKDYSLRKRPEKAYVEEETTINKEEARIFNRKFKEKYAELMQEKKTQSQPKKATISPARTVDLSEKAVRDRLERSMVLKMQRRYPGVFIEEQKSSCEGSASNGTTDIAKNTVDLAGLGEKKERNGGRGARKAIEKRGRKTRKGRKRKEEEDEEWRRSGMKRVPKKADNSEPCQVSNLERSQVSNMEPYQVSNLESSQVSHMEPYQVRNLERSQNFGGRKVMREVIDVEGEDIRGKKSNIVWTFDGFSLNASGVKD